MLVFQMAGVSGTGKSTLARALGTRLGAVVLDLDVLKSKALDGDAEWKFSGWIAYEGMWAIADSLLAQGFSVILDSPCRFEWIVKSTSAIARKHAATYAFVECVLTNEAELSRRLRSRPRLRSQMVDVGKSGPDAPESYLATVVREDGPAALETRYPSTPWLRIDTQASEPDQALELALAYLEDLDR